MAPIEDDDLDVGELPVLDPYETLGLERSATSDQVKSAYRKAALRNHPDKVSAEQKEEATKKFQSIAFAYAILSDSTRRKRYDETGSTSESIVDSDGFSWSEFYREQFRDAISDEAIKKFADKYKHSDEERESLLAAYTKYKGDMDKIYEAVILSDVLVDDKRFREIIDEAIASSEVKGFPKYVKETKQTREKRVKAAKREATEAEEYAKELGVHDKLFGGRGGGKKTKKDAESDLAALIKRNQAGRVNALDALAEKYGATPKAKGGKKRKEPEPEIDDDEFAAIQAKMSKRAAAKKAKK